MKRIPATGPLPAARRAALTLLARAVVANAAIATLAVPATAGAQANAAADFPNKPIRIVVPYPPGAFNDTLARTFAERLQGDWKQTVVVDNKPGGNTVIGNSAVANAPADGYTLLVTPLPFSVLPSLYGEKLPYDAIKSFAPVVWAGSTQNVLAIRQGFPGDTVAKMLDHVRANPGKVNFASTGSGSSNHLSAELFKSMTRTDMVHVPYKGSAPAVTALLAGEIDVYFDNLPNLLPHIQAGKVKAIGVTGLKRAPLLPDVPTIDEAGVKGYEVNVWFGIQAPAGTPKPVVDKLNAKMVEILKEPKVVESFRAKGVEIVASTPEQFAGWVRSEVDKWTKVVKDAGVKID